VVERTLIAMRHAKSAWPVGIADEKRPLSGRGRRDAVVAGQLLSSRFPRPDEIIVSPAKRARQTVKLVQSALGPVPTSREDRVFAASWWDLLDVLHEVGEQVRTLMLVGHNPGLEDLVRQLAGHGEERAVRQLSTKFPTSAIAVLRAELPWSQWGAGCAELRSLSIPRAG